MARRHPDGRLPVDRARATKQTAPVGAGDFAKRLPAVTAPTDNTRRRAGLFMSTQALGDNEVTAEAMDDPAVWASLGEERAALGEVLDMLGLRDAPAVDRAPGRCGGCGAELTVTVWGHRAEQRKRREAGLCAACARKERGDG